MTVLGLISTSLQKPGGSTLNEYIPLDYAEDAGMIDQSCEDGHFWWARMFRENGALFFENDDDSKCPICGGNTICE